MPLFEFLVEKEVPINTPWPGSTELDGRGGDHGTPEDVSDDAWIWRTTISDTVHTAGAARNALDKGSQTVGVINGTSQGERSWAEAFISAYENGGGSVATQVEVEEGASSYQSQLDRLYQADVDAAVIAVALEDATTMLRDWKNASSNPTRALWSSMARTSLATGHTNSPTGGWFGRSSSRVSSKR